MGGRRQIKTAKDKQVKYPVRVGKWNKSAIVDANGIHIASAVGDNIASEIVIAVTIYVLGQGKGKQ
jgi:predicted regulator of Ras-like GTPase activity (Roadblock/LC7/MglB family)